MAKQSAQIIELGGDVPTNGAAAVIEASQPYTVRVQIVGSADIIFHRWNAEAVDGKGRAAKGSKAKKTDDIESYVYRNDAGELCVPGEYVRQSIIGAAKFKQDPRSPRKSAVDLYKAGVVNLTALASLGATRWDYEDRRRVMVQRNGINRTRPAMKAGWSATFDLMVLLPEYITESDLNDAVASAGRLIGIGDYRPTYGRYQIASFSRT